MTMPPTCADLFNKLVRDLVYEGDKTEQELALFIDPTARFDRSGLHFGDVAVPSVRWILFRDRSLVLSTGRGVPWVGMVEDGKGSEIEHMAAMSHEEARDILFIE